MRACRGANRAGGGLARRARAVIGFGDFFFEGGRMLWAFFPPGDLWGWGNWELSAARSPGVLVAGAGPGAKF